jgi:hypothetical protein
LPERVAQLSLSRLQVRRGVDAAAHALDRQIGDLGKRFFRCLERAVEEFVSVVRRRMLSADVHFAYFALSGGSSGDGRETSPKFGSLDEGAQRTTSFEPSTGAASTRPPFRVGAAGPLGRLANSG